MTWALLLVVNRCDEVMMNLADGQQHEVVQQEASLRQRTGTDHGGDVHRVAFLLGREEKTSRHAARKTSGGADREEGGGPSPWSPPSAWCWPGSRRCRRWCSRCWPSRRPPPRCGERPPSPPRAPPWTDGPSSWWPSLYAWSAPLFAGNAKTKNAETSEHFFCLVIFKCCRSAASGAVGHLKSSCFICVCQMMGHHGVNGRLQSRMTVTGSVCRTLTPSSGVDQELDTPPQPSISKTVLTGWYKKRWYKKWI